MAFLAVKISSEQNEWQSEKIFQLNNNVYVTFIMDIVEMKQGSLEILLVSLLIIIPLLR
jgi:hypothetical protein